MRTDCTIWLLIGFIEAFALCPVPGICSEHAEPSVRDTLHFRGQFSAWANVSPANDLPVWAGGRIIPQANYEIFLPSGRQFDFEVSANIRGSSGFSFFDSLRTEGNIKAYRAWARFSGTQFELRAGLQKINFGSAAMLRPLMWFDKMDPRDPLQLTDGVWGLLGRYYFLNNASVWLWTLHGNKGQRAWEILETPGNRPEFGGRIQVPVLPGEAAFSYHYRQTRLPRFLRMIAASPRDVILDPYPNGQPTLTVGQVNKKVYPPAEHGSYSVSQSSLIPGDLSANIGSTGQYLVDHARIPTLSAGFPLLSGQTENSTGSLLPPGMEGIHPEHRFALDGKWDIGPGIWFESVWVHNAGDFGILSNQAMLNIGTDYTFGVGNGLNLVFEHLIFSYDEKTFAFENSAAFSALSASYPLSMNHHLSTILYRDWENRNFYSFLNWKVQLRNFMCYTMVYWNPKQLQLPQMASADQLFTGKGVQVMVVYSF